GWISEFLLGPPRKNRLQATQTGLSKQRVHSYKAPALNHKARVVCEGCNHGWMSDIESTACDVLKPMMVGRPFVLDTEQQVAIRAWIVLRAMILERAAAEKQAVPFYTQAERIAFADCDRQGSLEPVDGTYIWLFQFKSQQWVARSNVANTEIHV